jgi:sigma-54 dependent transcriptional regulator, acetoin dehydrogenase operon transcriptional activator AcoR
VSEVTTTSPPPHGIGTVHVRVLHVLPVGGETARTQVLDEALPIGREGCVEGPLALTDSEVSRHHATIERAGDDWYVTDRGSRNGTFVDGARAERARLVDGTVIRVGRTLLVHTEADIRADERLGAPAGSLLVGGSIAAMRIHSEIGLVAKHALPVLVLGETGVGKELVAAEIHRRSKRTGAFVPVNCAAIAPELAESELFGHVAGAFTGAARAADGLFVAADGGTLFLDEVGELRGELQAKLLRALANGEVRAVGSAATRTVDVRVIAATLRDLDEAVKSDRFRADLFNRLAGWRVDVSPLRLRRDDIVPIAQAFVGRKGNLPLSADAAEALLLHDWPGNVRELEREITAAVVRATAASADEIALSHLPRGFAARLSGRPAPAPASVALPMPTPMSTPAVPTRDELCQMLERESGNVARIAEHYGKDRQQIYRWAKRYDIDLTVYRSARDTENE